LWFCRRRWAEQADNLGGRDRDGDAIDNAALAILFDQVFGGQQPIVKAGGDRLAGNDFLDQRLCLRLGHQVCPRSSFRQQELVRASHARRAGELIFSWRNEFMIRPIQYDGRI